MNDEEFFQLVNDRLEGWELADFLGLSALDICLEFEHKLTSPVRRQLALFCDLIDEDEEENEEDY